MRCSACDASSPTYNLATTACSRLQYANRISGANIIIIQSEVDHMYEDKTLVCKECGNEFIFTAGEQEFYAEKGFVNEPQRCKACRDARKNAGRPEREMHDAVCANCGKDCKVPFQPREDRPVYCSECFASMKGEN